MLTPEQELWIDVFIQTSCPELASLKAGFPKKDALKVGLDLLSNDEIRLAIIARKEQLKNTYEIRKLDKYSLSNNMWFQYGQANKAGKTKEATEILEKIARWNGVEPDKIVTETHNLTFNNLDGDKI